MKFLNRLREKPWYVQMGAFALVAGLLYAAFWYFVTSPIHEETAALGEQVNQLKADNLRAQIAAQHINEVREQYKQRQSEYEDLKALLPEQRELTSILAGLQDRARGRLSVRRFTPKEDVQQDFYMGKPIEVEVTGSYNSLGAFFADLAAYQRIVSITDFKINQAAEQGATKSIDGQFLLTAYYVSAEKLQNSQVASAPNAPAAPNAAPGVVPASAPAK